MRSASHRPVCRLVAGRVGGYPSAEKYPAKGYLVEGACNCAIELRAASLQ
jgi:hypothetical protein